MQARWLFGIAALFNFSVAAGLIAMRPWLTPLLRLDPASGSNALLIDVAAVLVLAFGYAYARVAADPRRFREYIVLGIVGKLLVVLVAAVHLFALGHSWPLPALAAGDLVFAVLFWIYLRNDAR